MDHLNITNVHNNIKSELWIGLDKKRFYIRNTGDTIVILDDRSMKVNRLQIGENPGFNITNTGTNITIDDNDQNKINKLTVGKDDGFYIHHNIRKMIMCDAKQQTNELVVGGSSGFSIKANGSTIEIVDAKQSASKLKIGGPAGFTISFSGGKIAFSSNLGISPLTVSEPNLGGIPLCPFQFSHIQKFGPALPSAASVSTMSLREDDSTEEVSTETCMAQSPMYLPDASDLDEGTILVVSDGQWNYTTEDEMYNKFVERLKSQYNLTPI